MTERWKDIPGYEGRYQISNLGRVRMLPTRLRYLTKKGEDAYRVTNIRVLAQQKQNSGYLLVHLHLDNTRRALTVHRLVAEAFVAGAGETVNHKDGDKTNNHYSNLEWVSHSENHLHAVSIGLNKQAIPVRRADGVWFGSLSQAARATGCGIATIKRAAERGNGWAFA